MAQKTSRKPHYAVIGFAKTKGGLSINRSQMAQGEKSAVNMAARWAQSCEGAVAFSRVGDPEFGEFDDPVIVARYGQMPDELQEIIGGF